MHEYYLEAISGFYHFSLIWKIFFLQFRINIFWNILVIFQTYLIIPLFQRIIHLSLDLYLDFSGTETLINAFYHLFLFCL